LVLHCRRRAFPRVVSHWRKAVLASMLCNEESPSASIESNLLLYKRIHLPRLQTLRRFLSPVTCCFLLLFTCGRFVIYLFVLLVYLLFFLLLPFLKIYCSFGSQVVIGERLGWKTFPSAVSHYWKRTQPVFPFLLQKVALAGCNWSFKVRMTENQVGKVTFGYGNRRNTRSKRRGSWQRHRQLIFVVIL